MTFIAVIPARFDSMRLPGKALIDIAGQPMIQHVYRRATESRAERVLVATDDQRIFDVVRSFGGECVMTSIEHATGTDRLAEVVNYLNLADDAIVVNVQGDEPLLPASAIHQVSDMLEANPLASIATLCEPITSVSSIEDPNQVKVVLSRSGRALYFSRAPIPSGHTLANQVHYRHIGLYAYRSGFLKNFATWYPTPLETLERLEQLRALEYDHIIQVDISSESIPPGVDTAEDLKAVRMYLEDQTGV